MMVASPRRGPCRLSRASGLAQTLELHVVTVNDSGAIAWELATLAVDTLKALGLTAELHNVVSMLPIAEALLEFATKLDAAMTRHGLIRPLASPKLLPGLRDPAARREDHHPPLSDALAHSGRWGGTAGAGMGSAQYNARDTVRRPSCPLAPPIPAPRPSRLGAAYVRTSNVNGIVG